MFANMKLTVLGLASVTALILPAAAAPVETQKLVVREGDVCTGNSQLALPTPGQVIKADEPFEVLYCSGAYFKIRTLGVEAFFSSADNATSGVFSDVLGELKSVEGKGQFAFGGSFTLPADAQAEKSGYVYVQEKTTQYASAGTSLNMFKVPVSIAA